MRKVTIKIGKECKRFRVPTAEDWDDIAEFLASKIKPGDIVALKGKLGAGKTTFVQALARKLGIKRMPSSPTFALMRSYAVPSGNKVKRLIHVDAYRIEDEKDLAVLDLDEELSDGKSVLVIEWPERITAWLDRRPYVIRLDIE